MISPFFIAGGRGYKRGGNYLKCRTSFIVGLYRRNVTVCNLGRFTSGTALNMVVS